MTDSELTAPEARRQLYATMQQDLSFEEYAAQALAVGEEFLGVDNAYVAKVDQDTDYWKTVASTDSAGGSHPPGLRLDLDTTYCRRTVDQDGSIALHDAPNQGWDDDPAFEEHGLRCYHGTPIRIEGEAYGTVCFSDDSARGEPFSDAETLFAELIARLLERELQQQRSAAKIARLDRFAGVISHDLRNPLSVATGRVELELEARDSEHLRTAASAHERMDDLITDVLTVARQGDDIGKLESVSLTTMATGCWESVEASGSELRVDGDLIFRADAERVKQLFENLFRNSIEHGTSGEAVVSAGKAGQQGGPVRITVGPLDDSEGFFVADDGQGIPEPDRHDVLEPGYSTNGEGIGLGLAIVETIVSAHDWRLAITESDSDGARFEIHDVITNE